MTVLFDTLRIPAAVWDDIVAHSRAEAPRECCGLVVGPPGVAREHFRVTNLWPGIDFYEPDPDEAWDIQERAADRGEDIVAIYHSHPTDQARPSQRDIANAGYDTAVWVICSLFEPDSPGLRGYWIVDGVVTEVALVRVD